MHGKVGRPFGFSNACFAAASLFRNATGIKYRQLQGLNRRQGKRTSILGIVQNSALLMERQWQYEEPR